MSLEYIRKQYKVPAKKNVKIRYTGMEKPILGRIIGAKGERIKIKLNDTNQIGLFHPTWEMEYLI